MKSSKTPLSNTKVYQFADSNIYRTIVPFDDGSSLTIYFSLVNEKIKPCSLADGFVFSALSSDMQNRIKKLCKSPKK